MIRALKLWILGQTHAADKVIDRVRTLWPSYQYGYSRRFLLFALTDRPRAARAMLESAPEKIGEPGEIAVWNAGLDALETRSTASVARARDLCLETARHAPAAVNNIVMLLGALGEVDAAVDVTNGFLLWRGEIVSANQADAKMVNNYARRMTQWLFTPPLAGVRADTRFLRICEEFGLQAYWRARRSRPDFIAFA